MVHGEAVVLREEEKVGVEASKCCGFHLSTPILL
jgi:hypothetical protein